MPEIMRQYGQTLVVATAFGLLMAVLFVLWPQSSNEDGTTTQGSVLTDIGARAAVQIADTSTGTGTAEFEEHAARTAPTVAIAGPVKQRTTFLLTDHLVITDHDGAVWSSSDKAFMDGTQRRGGMVHVESITSSDGTEHIGSPTGVHTSDVLTFDHTTDEITFHKAGLYQVRVRVMDGDNVAATYTTPGVVDFVVQEEETG